MCSDPCPGLPGSRTGTPREDKRTPMPSRHRQDQKCRHLVRAGTTLCLHPRALDIEVNSSDTWYLERHKLLANDVSCRLQIRLLVHLASDKAIRALPIGGTLGATRKWLKRPGTVRVASTPRCPRQTLHPLTLRCTGLAGSRGQLNVLGPRRPM